MIYVPKDLIPEVRALIAKHKETKKALTNENSRPSPSHFYRNKQNRLKNKKNELED
jgi:succinate dehydrogenase/fumarate reductase-like Fe-S protein